MSSCKECRKVKCGCSSNGTPVQPPLSSNTPSCPAPISCAEVIDSNCVIYTGDNVSCNNQIVYQENDTQTEINEKIVDYFCNKCSSEYTYLEVPISSAQILTLYSSGVLLLPGASSGFYNDIEKIYLEYSYGTTAYNMTGVNNHITLQMGSDNLIDKTFITGAFNPERVARIKGFSNLSSDGTSSPVFLYNNQMNLGFQDLYLLATESNPTDGDGTILVKIWYKVRTFGTEL